MHAVGARSLCTVCYEAETRPASRICQVCDAHATHALHYTRGPQVYFRCATHAETVQRGPAADQYTVTPLEAVPDTMRPAALGTAGERLIMENLAEKTKAGEITVKRPDFTCRVSRGPRGIILYVQSEALHAHLSGLADGRTTVNAAGRTVFSVSTSRLRGCTLFTISDVCTQLLLDAALNDGHEVKIAEVMTASAAKDYVRYLMAAFVEYVRDYMSALRVTGSVTIDETVIRRAPVSEVV